MKASRPASRPPLDSQARALVSMYWASAAIAAVAWPLPGVMVPHGVLLPAALVTFAALGGWVARTGRVGPVSVHVLTVGAVLAGNSLVLCIDDPLFRAIAAGWNLMIPVYPAASLSRRALTGYLFACTACSAALVAVLPGSGLLVALRVMTIAGLVSLPLAHLINLRGELERALASARDLARTDTLTGLLNRRGMHERFAAVARAGCRHGEGLAVVSFDLDHFKRINDTLGHAAGDRVLVAVARTLEAGARSGDVVVRLGGEEISLIAAVSSEVEAVELAERLRARIRADAVEWSLTTSVGVAVALELPRKLDGEGAERLLAELLEEADQCLYHAKAAGRDRVVGPRRAGARPGGRAGAGEQRGSSTRTAVAAHRP